MLGFGPFRVIFGPLTQIIRTVASDGWCNCVLYYLKSFLTSCSLFRAIETVQLYWLFTEEFLVGWQFSYLELVTNMTLKKYKKLKLSRSWGVSSSNMCFYLSRKILKLKFSILDVMFMWLLCNLLVPKKLYFLINKRKIGVF